MNKGDIVYISDITHLEPYIVKCELVTSFLNSYDYRQDRIGWLARCIYNDKVEHRIIFKEEIFTDSSEYDKQMKRIQILEKIDCLKKKLKEMK